MVHLPNCTRNLDLSVQRALTFDVQKDFSFRITHVTAEEKNKDQHSLWNQTFG